MPGHSAVAVTPRPAQLLGERFGERQHVGLGRCVHRQRRHRLEGGDRRHVQDAPPPAPDHRRDEGRQHRRQAADVQIDHRLHTPLRHLDEAALLEHARAVDEDVDRDAPPAQRRGERFGGFGLREVGRNRDRLHAELICKRRGERFELVGAARNQHQVHAVAREATCQRLADARRRAGDERRLLDPRRCASHGLVPLQPRHAAGFVRHRIARHVRGRCAPGPGAPQPPGRLRACNCSSSCRSFGSSGDNLRACCVAASASAQRCCCAYSTASA